MMMLAQSPLLAAELSPLLAAVPAEEFFWLVPLCIAIAIVSSAAHREDARAILRHSVKSTGMILGGLMAFMVGVSYIVEWLLT